MADIKTATEGDQTEKTIEQWKIKKLIKNLELARGNGTSMISLIVPPKDQIARVQKMLAEEYGTASNIKSRVTRLSVLSAITSTQQRLKLYNKVPPNGLVVYCGTICTDEGKERMVNIDIEPFRPINTSLYLCDNKFHVEALKDLLSNDEKFGFLVMDGQGTLYGSLSGSIREVLHKFSVELPKKHGRGGQSSMRFCRIRMEKRLTYLKRVAEIATTVFINPLDGKVNVKGLVLAGSAEFKNELAVSDWFDARLKSAIIATVDVSYGGENGFNQAIELCADALGDVKFVKEKRLIQQYFDEISQDTGKFCFGINDTLKALDAGACLILIVYEDMEEVRWELKNSNGASNDIAILKPDVARDPKIFLEESGAEKEVVSEMSLVEWLTENYKDFGCSLEFVTNRSQEGSQFVKGFGGIGGILRYRFEFDEGEDINYDGDGDGDDLLGSDDDVGFGDDGEFDDFGL